VTDSEKISSSEYAIDGNLSRFTGMAGLLLTGRKGFFARRPEKED
jgi:hypothetical protein